MTRREGLAALGLMFVLFTAGITWQFGPFGLVICALLGGAVVVFCFERVDKPRGEALPDALPREVLAALERDLSL